MGRLSLHPDKFKPTPGMVIAVFDSVGIDYHLSHKEMLIRCPFHNDSGHKRHCYVNVKNKPGVFHCLGGETRILTRTGTKEIRACLGEQSLLTSNGTWAPAVIRNFGKQKLWEIQLIRNCRTKTIRATASHRWFVRGTSQREVLTSKLAPGDYLAYEFGQGVKNVKIPSPFGVSRGFTFGDGFCSGDGGSEVRLWGDKSEMLPYFSGCEAGEYATPNGVRGIRCSRLPKYFKVDFPGLTESSTYLMGWLAGLFAADGCVSTEGHPTIASSRLDVLQFVRDLCAIIGIGTHPIKQQTRLGFGKILTVLYSVALMPHTLIPEFFVREKHKQRFIAHDYVVSYNKLAWKIVAIRETDDYEDVFCAEVASTHNFTLEDNILTGNCFAGQCKAHGDFMDLIVGITKWNAYKALTFCRQFAEAELPELPPPPEPPSEAELVKYKFWHPYCFDRGLTRDTLRRWGIGYDREENAVVMPWRSAVGQLCGLKRRYIITKRYIMTEGFVPTLFGAQFIQPCESIVWLFEAEFDAMLVDQTFREEGINDCACAIGGSDISEGQLRQLLTLQPAGIVLFMDNDPVGREATEKLLEKFLGRARAIVAQYPEGAKKDAGELSRSQLREMITATRGRL